MIKTRLIACLLIRDGFVVQSIGFEKYYPIGKPDFSVENLNRWDVDEIVILDISTNKQSPDLKLIQQFSSKSFIPISVGGGIKCLEDAKKVIGSGADKVVVNSRAIESPNLISEISNYLGTQCLIISIDCKYKSNGDYRVYANGGRTATDVSPNDWAKQAEKLGAGEILLNSIDRDGSKRGYDIRLIQSVTKEVSIPVIAIGGGGKFTDFSTAIIDGGATAVAAGNMFHFVEHSTILAKSQLSIDRVTVRVNDEINYIDFDTDSTSRILG